MSSPFDPIAPVHYNAQKPDLKPNQQVKRVAVLYATREGHTCKIAERIAIDLRALDFDVDLLEVRHPLPFSLEHYCAAVLAASVHAGSHEKEMIQFVKDHRSELNLMTTAFLSVTLSEAGAEMRDKSLVEHARFVQDVDTMLSKFFNETNWHPTLVKPVAGALLYTQYNFLLRLIMRRIARKAGAATDVLHDYVYTDWVGLDKFINDLAAEIRGTAVAEPHAHGGLRITDQGTKARHA
jgi:menaquinone-dependent protoporphyrinogen oxidase